MSTRFVVDVDDAEVLAVETIIAHCRVPVTRSAVLRAILRRGAPAVLVDLACGNPPPMYVDDDRVARLTRAERG